MKLKRWEYALIAGILLCLCTLAYAFYAYEAVTVSYISKALTTTTYGRATKAFMTLETNNIYWTIDGVTIPTSAGVGHKLEVGQNLTLYNQDEIRNFRAVRSSATDAALKVTYWN